MYCALFFGSAAITAFAAHRFIELVLRLTSQLSTICLSLWVWPPSHFKSLAEGRLGSIKLGSVDAHRENSRSRFSRVPGGLFACIPPVLAVYGLSRLLLTRFYAGRTTLLVCSSQRKVSVKPASSRIEIG